MKAHLRLLASSSEAAVTPLFEKEDLPSNSAQYASPDTRDQTETAPESSTKESLYQRARKLQQKEQASKGGISDATGTPNSLEPHLDAQPNAQRSLNGSTRIGLTSALRLLADRLGTEEDDLTKDQENYGTHANNTKSGLPELFDPETSSSYSRENNVNAGSTVDDPEPADGFNMLGEEGIRNTSQGKKRSGTQMKTVGKSTNDGDFDPAGRTTGDRLITQDPKTEGYLNIHSAADGEEESESESGEEGAGDTTSSYPLGFIDDATTDPEDAEDDVPETSLEDAELEALASEESEEIDADADPRLFNMANQPMGMSG